MSDYATIILMNEDGSGVPTSEILKELAAIRKWDNGHDYPIRVVIVMQDFLDSIANVENACQTNIGDYIMKKYKTPSDKIFKSGGDSELWLVDHPDKFSGREDGKMVKRRSRMTHLTPKKKKRKK